MKLSIMYWNVGRSRTNVVTAVEGHQYDILAITEPWTNNQKQQYCPSYSHYNIAAMGGRATLYIHKRHDQSTWQARSGPDWCAVTIAEAEQPQPITIYTVYSQVEAKEWASPLTYLLTQQPTGADVIVGDLNLHHPLWDKEGRTSPHAGTLLQLTMQWNLSLRTPWGEPTRIGRPGERDSTIDLAWASEDLKATYRGAAEYTGSDHVPQLLDVDTGAPQLDDQQCRNHHAQGFSWSRFDPTIAAADARTWIRLHGPLQTADDIDRAADQLIAQLTRIAEASAPRRLPNKGKATPWWNREVAESVKAARKAEREYRRHRSQARYIAAKQAQKQKAKAIRKAQREKWRQTVEAASTDNRLLWTLARWGRLRSHTPTTAASIPALGRTEGNPTATTHEEKAQLLAERFFPAPEADLSDIIDRTFTDDTFPARCLQIRTEVTPAEVQNALRLAGRWKAPGEDMLPTGFLLACGPPLFEALAKLATASFAAEHFPTRFRKARVAVLQKPGKTAAARQTPGGWRPISLLSTVGKAIEFVLTQRITQAAEDAGALPRGQMGNRKNRSTELAIRVVIEAAQTAWDHGAVASLLQLDIKGAFDTVNHTRLLDTLRQKGFPPWVVRWIRSYLTGRQAQLSFDGREAEPVLLRAGVPQGSPLSPILFILYIATLYEALEAQHPHLLIVGFADDTNLMAFGQTAKACCMQLQDAWATCTSWAKSRGMQFAPEKSELMHFSRERRNPTASLRLGTKDDSEKSLLIKPVETARFLGVWLDRKLRWGPHLQQIRRKLSTQVLALTKITGSVWGCSLAQARHVYTAVIRAALAYGASAFHTPTTDNHKPQGIAKQLGPLQSQCLRAVAGAYRATPIRALETETAVPPVDLYLNQRLAHFEARLEATGMKQLIENSCAAVAHRLRNRLGYKPVRPRCRPDKGQLARQWQGTGSLEEAVTRSWKARWEEQIRSKEIQSLTPADRSPLFDKTRALLKHKGLRKSESSLVTQLRTGKIGLKAFLWQRSVPGVASPRCQCGTEWETPEHLALRCPELSEQRATLRARLGRSMRTRRDFEEATAQAGTARILARWFKGLGKLSEYKTAAEVWPDRQCHGDQRDAQSDEAD